MVEMDCQSGKKKFNENFYTRANPGMITESMKMSLGQNKKKKKKEKKRK